MSALFSTISGQFSKSLILGSFVPSTIFVLLFYLLVVPLLPSQWLLFQPLEALDTQWRVVALTFVTIVLSGLLFNINIPLIRLFEGYPWLNTRLGQRRKRHYASQFLAASGRYKATQTLKGGFWAKDPRASAFTKEADAIGRILNSEYPHDVDSILPTRLGNVIRSFETYSLWQYRLAAITMWPRLVAKIDKDYAAVIDDAKTSFDFMINGSTLSALLALLLGCAGLYYGLPLTSRWGFASWLSELLVSALFSCLFYALAIGRAAAWGDTVKSAFDLYRHDLLKQLGIQRDPKNLSEERDLWTELSTQTVFGDMKFLRKPEYVIELPTVRDRNLVDLVLTRGVSLADSDGGITVTLQIKNVDKEKRLAENVVVIESIQDGFDYEWASARYTGSQQFEITGSNPYKFTIGSLPFNERVNITYRMLPRKTDK
jgi:hypothetical protein